MKVLAATLAVLLLVAICSSSIDASTLKQGIPTFCCFRYISRPIPRSIITFAYMTSRSCLQPAVVLVTRKGREVCANPEAAWVQKYLKDLNILEY